MELIGYAKIISESTGLIDPVSLHTIEEIMRHDIFHSTLDWQSREQLEEAARIAADMMERYPFNQAA